ncbi:MAG TPA: hypothetical protein VMS98_07560 [Thermoanaerobaculia bacterium]|nr:hypothetical protein [Thermoanaerobaculia bacterium]
MSEPVSTLILILATTMTLAAVRFFKTLDSDFWSAARTPIVAGLVAGVLIRLIDAGGFLRIVLIGVIMTAAALYVRLTGDETEAAEGMLLGAISGVAACLPVVLDGDGALRVFAELVLAGAVAGSGITFAAFHVADKARQIILDVVTAAVAVAAAQIPIMLSRLGVTDVRIATMAAAIVPLVIIATVVRQYPDVRAQLRHEASLGFIDDRDVRPTAHPLLRLGRAGWIDASAHREFVRIANRIALRKRQQRNRSDEMARLYQLEIIKLRMQLQEMARIDHAALFRKQHPHDDELHSDTMARQ